MASTDEMLAACLEMAPDFRIVEEDTPAGRIIAARCELGGRPHELSHVIGEQPVAKLRRHLLEASMHAIKQRVRSARI